MADRARTVAQVIAGEAVSGTPEQRQADMRAIASVIANRSRALGVTPEQVVQRRSEFNAYDKPLPAGTAKLTGMAQEAIDYVSAYGPVHAATFYATPAATRNLPKGLRAIAATTGHRYFDDPQNRAINTAVGTRPFNARALSKPATSFTNPLGPRDVAPPGIGPTAQVAARPTFANPATRAIEAARGRVPTSIAAPMSTPMRSIGGLAPAAPRAASPPLGARPLSPVQPTRSIAPVAATIRTTAPSRVIGVSLVRAAPVGRALSPLGPIGTGVQVNAAPKAAVSRAVVQAASRPATTARIAGVDVTPAALSKGPRFGAPPQTKTTLTAAQDANLASRLGAPTPARPASAVPSSTMTSLSPSVPASGAVRAIGGLIDRSQPAAFDKLSSAAVASTARALSPVSTAATLSPVSTARAISPVSTTRALSPVSTTSVAPRISTPQTIGPVATTARAVPPVDRQAKALSPVPSTATPAKVVSSNTFDAVGMTPDQRARAIASVTMPTKTPYNVTPAFSTAKPKIDAISQPPIPGLQRVAPAPAVPALSAPVNVPSRKVAAVAPVAAAPVVRAAPQISARPVATRSIGIGLPSRPAAPQQSFMGRMGAVIGSAFGTAPSAAARSAMATGSFDGFSHSGSGSRAGASVGTGGAASAGARGNGIGPGGSGPRDPTGPNTGRNATGANNNTSKSSSKKR